MLSLLTTTSPHFTHRVTADAPHSVHVYLFIHAPLGAEPALALVAQSLLVGNGLCLQEVTVSKVLSVLCAPCVLVLLHAVTLSQQYVLGG